MNKRLLVASIAGAVLGVFCIIGIGLRLGYSGNELLLMSAWFNRVLMGVVIGLAGDVKINGKNNVIFRGAILGAFVSFAWYLDTGFLDTLGFLAGIAYGIIIDLVATKYG